MTANAAPVRRALVVDDERALATLIGGYLERAGFEPPWPATGRRVWLHLSTRSP